MKPDRLILLVLTLVLSNPVFSQTELFEIDLQSKQQLAPPMKIHNSLENVAIEIHQDLISAKSNLLTFSLLDGIQYKAAFSNSEQYADDWMTWSGTLLPSHPKLAASAEMPGYAFISNYKGRVSAVFHTDYGHHYLITPDGKGGHILSHVDGHTGCPVEKGNDSEFLSTHRHVIAQPATGKDKLGSNQIDVAMLYSRELLESAQTQQIAESFMTTAFAIANNVFMNSQLDTRYRLVYLGPNPDTNLVLPLEPNDENFVNNKAVNVALDWLNQKPKLIEQLQTAYGADMVALFTPLVEDTDFDICGIANLPISPNGTDEVFTRFHPGGSQSTADFIDEAYIGIEINCGQSDLTFAHEHGHNLGMNHDENTDPSPDRLQDFYLGYLFSAGKRNVSTMMGCSFNREGGVPGSVCNRVPYISNDDPNVTYNGAPTGDADHNNADAAEMRTGDYAGFRATVSNATPSINILSPPDGAVFSTGVPITFRATATDFEDGNISSQIEWRSSIKAGLIGTGGFVVEPIFVTGNHVITASVTDSGGKRVEQSVRLTIQGGQPEIEVRAVPSGSVIPSGNLYTFPSRSVDDLPLTRSFDICNVGQSGLLIDNPSQLVTGAGFTQTGNDPDSTIPQGQCSRFNVAFNVENPDTYSGLIRIENNDANEDPYVINLSATATGSAVQLVATYVPGFGEARTSFGSSSANPPTVDYYYDPNLGTFEERPGSPCDIGTENPTYFKLSLGGSILNNGGIDACSYSASWDDNNPVFQCSAELVDLLNAGEEVIINTSTYLQDLDTCEDKYPLEPHVEAFDVHWLQADFVVDNVTYPRRVNFRQTAFVEYYYANADTYVSQDNADDNFGEETELHVSNFSGDARYAFTRYRIILPAPFVEYSTARLRWHVQDNPISHADLHKVCGVNWDELGMTWANWTDPDQAQGSCGIVDTATNLPANQSVRFNLDGELGSLFTNTTVSFGAATTDNRLDRTFASREGPGATRPLLKVTFYRP